MSRRVMLSAAAVVLASCSSGGDDAAVVTTAPPIPTAADRPTTSPPSSEAGDSVSATEQPPLVSVASVPEFEPAPIEWEQFNDAVDVGTLEVPVDYANPAGERFTLRLARYNALDQDDKIGTLLVNPGGPGYGGSDLAITAASRYDRPLRERFDIIGWDPRGTGQSLPPIDCIDNYDEYFTGDDTPQNEQEQEAVVDTAERFVAECEARSGNILDHVGTNESARDIDIIRRALGEEKISYFGFSYGSELGGAWATMFPDTVRAMVVDGAADPDADPLESTMQQLRGFEASLTSFLADCSERESCPFNNRGDAETAFAALMTQLDANPVIGDPDRPPVNRSMATVAVVMAMYSDTFWPALAQSLAAAQEGDGAGLLQLFDTYYERGPDGTWGNQLEAFQVISCVDESQRRSFDEVVAGAAQLHEAAPTLIPDGAIMGYMCSFMPPVSDPRVAITAAGAGPVLVIGTTGDPSTPLDSTRRMADQLDDGHLVVVTANQHTGYGVNRCVIDTVNEYLIDLEVPDGEKACT